MEEAQFKEYHRPNQHHIIDTHRKCTSTSVHKMTKLILTLRHLTFYD